VLLSNLYSSIIWIAYILVRLSFILFKNNDNILKVLKENKVTVASLLIYVVVLIMEATGDNAQQLTSKGAFWSDLHHTLGCYLSILNRMNKWFMCFCFLVLLYSLYLYQKDKNKENTKSILKERIIFFLANFVIINLFYILVSAKAVPEYVVWQDRLLAEVFWGFLGVSCCMAYCLKTNPQIKVAVPFIFLLLLGDTNTTGKTFNDVYMFETVAENSKKLAAIAEKADKENIDYLDIYLPYNGQGPESLNWPYTICYGSELSETFQKFNVSKRPLLIHLIAVKGRTSISTELKPYENDSIVKDSFWWGEDAED